MRKLTGYVSAFLASILIAPLIASAGDSELPKGEKTRVTLASKRMSDKDLDRVSAGESFYFTLNGFRVVGFSFVAGQGASFVTTPPNLTSSDVPDNMLSLIAALRPGH